jgi:hypothetical protein
VRSAANIEHTTPLAGNTLVGHYGESVDIKSFDFLHLIKMPARPVMVGCAPQKSIVKAFGSGTFLLIFFE